VLIAKVFGPAGNRGTIKGYGGGETTADPAKIGQGLKGLVTGLANDAGIGKGESPLRKFCRKRRIPLPCVK
jgi:hypothetical protein